MNIQMIPFSVMKWEKFCFWGIEYLMSLLSLSLFLSPQVICDLPMGNGWLVGQNTVRTQMSYVSELRHITKKQLDKQKEEKCKQKQPFKIISTLIQNDNFSVFIILYYQHQIYQIQKELNFSLNCYLGEASSMEIQLGNGRHFMLLYVF